MGLSRRSRSARSGVVWSQVERNHVAVTQGALHTPCLRRQLVLPVAQPYQRVATTSSSHLGTEKSSVPASSSAFAGACEHAVMSINELACCFHR